MDKLEALRVLGFKYLTKDTLQETDEFYNKYVIAWKMIPVKESYDEYVNWEYSDSMADSDEWGLHVGLPIEGFKFMIGREEEVVVIDDEIMANQRYNFEREYFCEWGKENENI